MSADCIFRNPLRRDGTSQAERLVAALRPGYVSVDERGLAELLAYAHRYARLLRYYTPEDKEGGDWVAFLEKDASMVVALMRETDAEGWKQRFESKRSAAREASQAGRLEAFAGLLQIIADLAQTFDSWRRRAIEGLALRTAIDRLIRAGLSQTLKKTAIYIDTVNNKITQQTGKVAFERAAFDSIWQLPLPLPSSTTPVFNQSIDAEYQAAVGTMVDAFNRFHQALIFLIEQADTYLAESIEHYPKHQPHMALFLAFLHIFRYAQEHLNTITEKHLEFYYKEVLQLQPKPAQPDKVHLIFELAKNVDKREFLLKKDTELCAGKDKEKEGRNVFFATDAELVINRAQIDPVRGLKTLYIEKTSGKIVKLYATEDADSADGQGAAITDPEGKWPAFGVDKTLDGKAIPAARLGFAIASPMFLLAGGTRNVTIILYLKKNQFLDDAAWQAEFAAFASNNAKGSIKVQASGKEKWVDVELNSMVVTKLTETIITFKLNLSPEQEAVLNYDAKILDGKFETNFPLIRFLFVEKGSNAVHPYQYFQKLEIEKVDLTVNVDGLRNLILESDFGMLDTAKPFYPFGPAPYSGGSFYIGSTEAFLKSWTIATVQLKWANLPASENFSDYYKLYKTTVTGNDFFTASLRTLWGGIWVPKTATGEAIFDGTAGNPPNAAKDLQFTPPAGYKRDPGLQPFQRLDRGMRQGFVKVSLDRDFLHAEYPSALAVQAQKKDLAALPKPPYTPLISDISLNYTAEEQGILFYNPQDERFGSRVERIFQIGPFGQREAYAQKIQEKSTVIKLIPDFYVSESTQATAEGSLYIGIADLQPPQNLAMLFQVAEGSEDPEIATPEVAWSYLTAEGWKDFKPAEIIADGTHGLLGSGVIQFAMPEAMVDNNTEMPTGLHWIKASVAGNSAGIPKLIAVKTQAVVASFQDQDNDPARLDKPMLKDTISKLKTREAAIKSVAQPYASFGGKRPESAEAFYLRTSERLRHKRRAVSIFDYERLVLEQFPEVYKVKCLNHGCNRELKGVPNFELAPGYVRLVVVPNLRNRNAVDPYHPRLSKSKCELIQRYVASLASDFATIVVANPDYEELRVRFDVRFKEGKDKGHYTAELQKDIVKFLSPWLWDGAAELTFGGTVHRSSILNYVEERDYVDFVTNFRMNHILGEAEKQPPDVLKTLPDLEETMASHSGAALVSAPEKFHEIGYVTDSCEDIPPPATKP